MRIEKRRLNTLHLGMPAQISQRAIAWLPLSNAPPIRRAKTEAAPAPGPIVVFLVVSEDQQGILSSESNFRAGCIKGISLGGLFSKNSAEASEFTG